MTCKFCLVEPVDSFWSSWCVKCHRLQKLIALFGGEKISTILETVLIVDKETQKDKVAGELKGELTTREYNLRARKADSK